MLVEKLTLEDVAKELGQDVRWVKRNLIKPKAIEYIHPAHGVYFVTPKALRDYLQRKTVQTHVRVYVPRPTIRFKQA